MTNEITLPIVYGLAIDVRSKDARKLYNRVKALTSTIDIEEPAPYHADTSYSQVVFTTTKTESEIDAWLYKSVNLEWIGVVKS